jgi:hypothetical protein
MTLPSDHASQAACSSKNAGDGWRRTSVNDEQATSIKSFDHSIFYINPTNTTE